MKLSTFIVLLVTIFVVVYFVFFVHIFPLAFDVSDHDSSEKLELLLTSLRAEHERIKKVLAEMESDVSKEIFSAEKMDSSISKKLYDKPTLVNDKQASSISSNEDKEIKSQPSKTIKTTDQSNIDSSAKHLRSPTAILPSPISFATEDSKKNHAVVVVGGTDGSGTRRVVQILSQLGVAMVSEDPETYDIHADLIGGWPPVIKKVLKVSHSVDYDPKNFPNKDSISITYDVNRLISQVELDSHKPTSYKLAVGGVLPKRPMTSTSIKYGFKAPISMVLVPWLSEIIPHFKFIHVVRDGRDIAFSVNQGPVEKFYDDMYVSGRVSSPPEKAIQLWSDWNSQIYNWSKNRVKALSSDDKRSFGYLAVHTEDFVSTSLNIRFAAIKHLAIFVGANITDEDICCLASENVEFMGSHDRSQNVKASQVQSRYGKWKSKVANNPGLETSLHRLGNDGLSIFGYEPLRKLAQDEDRSESGFQCGSAKLECVPPGLPRPEPKFGPYSYNGQCNIYKNTDFRGGDLSVISLDKSDFGGCCRACKDNIHCKYFTLDTTHSVCYLKTVRHSVLSGLSMSHLVSGDCA